MTKCFTLHFLLFSITMEYYRIDMTKPTLGDLMKNTNLDTCTRLCGREPACRYMKSFNNFCLISSQISTSGIFSRVVPFVYEKCDSVLDLKRPSETIWRKPVYQFVYDQSGHFSPVVSPRRIVFSTTARKKIKVTVTFSGQCGKLTQSECKMYCMESGSTVRMNPDILSSASRTVHVFPKCRTIVAYLSPSTVTGKACSSDFNITLVSSPPESDITTDKGTYISNTASPSFLPTQTSAPTRDTSNLLTSTPSKIITILYSEFPDLRKDITTASSQTDASTPSVDSKIALTSAIYDTDYKSETERNNNVNAFKSLDEIATVSHQSPRRISTTSSNFHQTSIAPSQAPGTSFSLSHNRVKPSASSVETAEKISDFSSGTSKVTLNLSRNIISTSLQKVKNTPWFSKQTLYSATSQYPGLERVTSSINSRQSSESSGTDLPTSAPSTSGNTSKLSGGAVAAVSTGSFAILVLMVVVVALMCRLFRRNSDVTYTRTSTNANIKAIDLSRCRLNRRYFQAEVKSPWESSRGHWDNNAMSY